MFRSNPTDTVHLHQDSLRKLDSWLAELVTAGQVAGGVVGVGLRTGETHVTTFGTVETAEGTRPADRADRYLLTSMSKTFTALQSLLLMESGALALDTPLAELIPEFAVHGKADVRLWHILTHTSGIDDTHCNTAEGPDLGLEAADHLRAVVRAPLAGPPGSRVAYCSPPFWVLAEIIRVVTRQSWADHLRLSVLDPLGMTATGYAPEAEPPPRYVAARIADPRHTHLAEQVRRCAYPAGGVIGTMDDLLRYGHMLLCGGTAPEGQRVLAPATVGMLDEAWTVGLPGARDYEGGSGRTERGLGWALGGPGDLRSPRTLWHSGSSGVSMWVDADQGATVVLLTATWFLPRHLLGRVVNVALATVNAPPRRRSR